MINSESKNLLFNPDDPSIKREILAMIIQYLDENGFRSSAQILSEEGKINEVNDSNRNKDLLTLKNAINSNQWNLMESLQIDKIHSPRFIYVLYRHRFLELLLAGDSNSALQFLSSRLRPYRAFEEPSGDFDNLCLLLVEASSPSRSSIIPNIDESLKKVNSLIEDSLSQVSCPIGNRPIPKNRLIHLMQQAISLQLSCYPRGSVKSVVNDFVPAILPDSSPSNFPKLHNNSVKTLSILPNTETLLSAGSDSIIHVWNMKNKSKITSLKGHTGRVWSLATTSNVIASSGGDGTIRLWDINKSLEIKTLKEHQSDVYSIDIDSSSNKLISGGFDRQLILWDLTQEKSILKKTEHVGAITSVIFDPTGNMAITGGKDHSIKIWDLRNAIVVRTLSPVLSEVTSVASDRSFTKVLGSTKNSTHRIWDMRMSEVINLLKGHQNSSMHFIRAKFGPDDRTVLSGSDDGKIYCWGSTTGNILEIIPGHEKGCYDVIFSEKMNSFVSCGEDQFIKLWGRKKQNNLN